jgi:hypothetical protein
VRAERVLFLADRANLGRQALGEFANFQRPVTGLLFTQECTVQHLRRRAIDLSASVVTLAAQPGLVGTIYTRARNTIEEPQHLHRLVRMIGAETWSGFGVDVKGAIYEGLLERTASDVKSGAGQYFTPRPVIQACVEVLDPAPGQTVCDPACGTGGSCLPPTSTCAASPARATARPASACARRASPATTSSPVWLGSRR